MFELEAIWGILTKAVMNICVDYVCVDICFHLPCRKYLGIKLLENVESMGLTVQEIVTQFSKAAVLLFIFPSAIYANFSYSMFAGTRIVRLF
jgi:hypothetical protein